MQIAATRAGDLGDTCVGIVQRPQYRVLAHVRAGAEPDELPDHPTPPRTMAEIPFRPQHCAWYETKGAAALGQRDRKSVV